MQASDRGGYLRSPWPAFGEPEPQAAAADEAAGYGEEAEAEPFGSRRRALPVGARIRVQASSSHADATISHQTWFWAKLFRGRFRRPV